MSSTFTKLNLKHQEKIVVLNAPESFEPELAALPGTAIVRDLDGLENFEFFIAFVTREREIAGLSKIIAAKAKGDAVVWLVYPKGTSKKYKSEVSRDHGWQALRGLGFETVRAVAIDEDWSALRFRRTEYIKAMTPGRGNVRAVQGKARLLKAK
jgi:hypothetical protein